MKDSTGSKPKPKTGVTRGVNREQKRRETVRKYSKPSNDVTQEQGLVPAVGGAVRIVRSILGQAKNPKGANKPVVRTTPKGPNQAQVKAIRATNKAKAQERADIATAQKTRTAQEWNRSLGYPDPTSVRPIKPTVPRGTSVKATRGTRQVRARGGKTETYNKAGEKMDKRAARVGVKDVGKPRNSISQGEYTKRRSQIEDPWRGNPKKNTITGKPRTKSQIAKGNRALSGRINPTRAQRAASMRYAKAAQAARGK